MKNDKRKQIIKAAIFLFSQTHDFRRVSLEVIAEEAQVSPTTIYNNFETRENLVNEVIKGLIRDSLDRSRILIHSDLPFSQKLAGIISGKVNMDAGIGSEIISKLASRDKTIAHLINQLYEKEIKPLWKELMIEGKKQGYIDPRMDDEVLIVYLDILQAGFKSKPELLEGFKNHKELIEQLTHLMYNGFLIKEIDFFNKKEINSNESRITCRNPEIPQK